MIVVKKYNGEVEPFSFKKLQNSLKRSGATPEEIKIIINMIKNTVYNGISSKEIYKKAFQQLRKMNRMYASKYSLKRAIAELGPTGYPFEKLIGALLKHRGYDVQVGVVLSGYCVNHEVDVLAKKNTDAFPVECKFHSKYNSVNNVRIPLYIHSRFLDLQKKWNVDSNKKTTLRQAWIVSNTKFTLEAIKYASCVGIRLLGWNYPENDGINQHIDKFGLYPITALTSLTKREKDLLIKQDVILVKELVAEHLILHKIGLTPQKSKRILSEAKKLCSI